MRLAPLLAVLTLAACQTPQVSPTIVELPSTGYARGIDMATDSSDVVGELHGRPWLNFVARYYRDPASRWPALSPDEARRLAALGVKIVAVWEWHSGDPGYFTYATGYNDALSADRQARSVGQPPGSAIYFAVDFNARGGAILAVDQYFRGVNAGLAAAGRGRPEYKVGVYGSGAVCAAIRGAGLAQYAWLSGSTAWDGTAGYNDWNIRQGAQGARFANLSFSHDANEARNDYGGFQLGTYAPSNYANAATPAQAVVTVAAAAPVAAATAVSSAVTSIVPQPVAAAPPAPPSPVPAPPSAPAMAAVTASPAPAAPAVARVAPPASNTAAEVAALAAAEAKVAAIVSAPPRSVAAPEPSSRRASEPAASEEPPRERTATHGAKSPPAAKGKTHAAAASSRAVAAAPRRASAALASGSHEAAHKASVTKRSEDHAAHSQAAKAASVHASEKPPRHHAERRKS